MRTATTSLLLGAILCSAVPARAQSVLAGLDFWETQPGSTQTLDGPYGIPPDFFGPGSLPIGNPVIPLKGMPLGSLPSCPGADLGQTDTAIRRLADATFPGGETIPIELVQMRLVSIEPITVTYSASPPELWDLSITLPVPSTSGSMTLPKTHPNGGVFSAQFQVQPLFTFTRQSDLATRPFDPGPQPLQLAPGGAPWAYAPEPGMLEVPGCTTNFFPGVSPAPTGAQSALPPFSIHLTGPHTDIDLLWTTTPPTEARASTWGRLKTIYR